MGLARLMKHLAEKQDSADVAVPPLPGDVPMHSDSETHEHSPPSVLPQYPADTLLDSLTKESGLSKQMGLLSKSVCPNVDLFKSFPEMSFMRNFPMGISESLYGNLSCLQEDSSIMKTISNIQEMIDHPMMRQISDIHRMADSPRLKAISDMQKIALDMQSTERWNSLARRILDEPSLAEVLQRSPAIEMVIRVDVYDHRTDVTSETK